MGPIRWGRIRWGRIRWGETRAASLIALGSLAAMLAFGLLLSAYSDEIVWRFHERAALDGGFDVWLNDSCGIKTIARAPWFMMPVRWFSATMNLALPSPLFVRIEGIVALCANLPPRFRAAAAHSGEICAVGADRLDGLRETATATAG